MTIMMAAPKHLTAPFLFGPLTGWSLQKGSGKAGHSPQKRWCLWWFVNDEDIYLQQKMFGFRPSFTISHQLLLPLSVKTNDNYILLQIIYLLYRTSHLTGSIPPFYTKNLIIYHRKLQVWHSQGFSYLFKDKSGILISRANECLHVTCCKALWSLFA